MRFSLDPLQFLPYSRQQCSHSENPSLLYYQLPENVKLQNFPTDAIALAFRQMSIVTSSYENEFRTTKFTDICGI